MEAPKPEPTGLACPACREPIAVIENIRPGILAMHCPSCGNRGASAITQTKQ
jgi:hypothetical protein